MRKLLIGAALSVVMVMGLASPALGASHNPKGEFADFKECPLSRAGLFVCVHSVSSGGEFTIGKKTVPLVNPVTLQGGLEATEAGPLQFYGAENGDTLSKTPQPVPGGLLGVTAPTWWPKFVQDWFNNQINQGFTGVSATVELAGPATNVKISTLNLIVEQGTAISLPVKIKLSNPILGSNCYVGSDSKPVTIDFTSGTTAPPPPNKPLKGSKGELSFNETGTLVTLKGGNLVNNSFAAPAASGCGGIFSFFVDPLVNSILGAPSPAGTNTAILKGVLKTAQANAVRESE